MKRSLALAGLVLLLLAGPALADNGQQTTTLLSPSGQPTGGVWQRWMNASYMPTYNGPMVLDLGMTPAECGYATTDVVAGCTATTAFDPVDPSVQDLPETGLNVPSFGSSTAHPIDFARHARWTLLYEQGHVLDYRDLTDTDRSEFAALWNRPAPSGESIGAWWWQGESTDAFSTLGEWFSSDYMICALWPDLTWGILDHNAYQTEWDGAVPFVLGQQPKIFPVYNDTRTPSLILNGKHAGDTEWLAPTRAERRVRATQIRSCDLIRSWIS